MLTSRGRGLLAAGLVLLGVTRLTRATELVVLALPALVLPLLAWAWSRVPFQVEVRRWIEPRTVVRGGPCIGALSIVNSGTRRNPALEVLDRRGELELLVPVPRLDPGATHPTTYHLPTERRGVFPLGPLTVRRGDIFGVAEQTLDLGGRMTLCVHPRARHLDTLPGGMRASLEGVVEQIPFGSSVFHGLRGYEPGDDHRHIHWMSTARTGEPQVRIFRDSSIPTITVLLEDRASRYDGDRFEDAVDVVASILDLAMRNDLSLVVVTTGGASWGVAGEPLNGGAMLDALAGLRIREDDGRVPLETHHGGTTLVAVGGTTDGDDVAELTRLRMSTPRMTVCAVVRDAADVVAPDGTATLVVPDADALPDCWEEVTR